MLIMALTFIFISSSFAQQKRVSLGIAIGDLDENYARFMGMESNEGVVVKKVLEGSPSEKAGLRTGDVIVEINGKRVKNPKEFLEYTKTHNSNDDVYLSVIRSKGQVLKILVKPVDITTLPQVSIQKPMPFEFDKNIIFVDNANFEKEVMVADKPVLAYFYAKWCTPCKNFVPSINELAKKYSNDFKIVAIDVQKSENITKEYGIGGLVPSFLLFNNGKEFDKVIVPASLDNVENLLAKFMSYKEDRVEIFPEVGKEYANLSYVCFIDNTDLFVSKRTNKLSVWNYKEGALIKIFLSPVLSVSLNGRFVALTDSERTSVKVVDIITDLYDDLRINQFVEYMAVSGNGRYLAIYGKEKGGNYSTKIFDVKSKKVLKELSNNKDVKLEFSADNSILIISEYGKTRLIDTLSWREYFVFEHADESFREIRFSPDGRYLLAYGKKWHLYDLKMLKDNVIDISIIGFSRDSEKLFVGKKGNFFELVDSSTRKAVMTFSNYLAPIRFVNMSFDVTRALSAGSDNVIRLWDTGDGKEVAQFIDYPDGEWIVLTKEGYYSSSLKGHEYLKVRKGNNVYTVDQFYDVFYRPDIVKAKLRGEDISGLITVTLEEAIKNPPPIVEIVSLPKEINQPKARVCYRVKSSGGGIGEVRLFHNGKLVYSDGFYIDISKTFSKKQFLTLTGKNIYENMRGIKITAKGEVSPIQSKSKGELYEDCKEIDAINGENEITITAFNGQNTVQSLMKTVSFKANLPNLEPNLYILAIGIDKYKNSSINLRYAVKDARDIVDRIVKQSSTIYKQKNIHFEILVDERATKTNILRKIEELSQKIRPEDSFIFFSAGHGILLQNQYYMLTHDFYGEISNDTIISSNEIVEMSKKIKSLSQLFIFDTCHAGGLDYIVSGLYDARMSVLAKKMGLHIYASASSLQESIDGYKGNGLFTYSLLEGLNNNAKVDKNGDNLVSLFELGDYVKQSTFEYSKSIGHLQTPIIINFGKDNFIYKLVH